MGIRHQAKILAATGAAIATLVALAAPTALATGNGTNVEATGTVKAAQPAKDADPANLKYEAENLYYLSNNKVEQYDDGASNGGWVKSGFTNKTYSGRFDGTKDYVGFYLNIPQDLSHQYQLKIGYRAGSSRGSFNVSVTSGATTTQVGTLDQYAGSTSFSTWTGTKNIAFDGGGTAYVKFELNGKNSASSGYSSGIDYIQLVKTDKANADYHETTAKAGTTYYVSNDGDDNADGTSPETAWKTIDKVNQTVGFGAGSKILFQRGGVWQNETLAVRGNGSENNPITIGAYGEGAQPQFKGNGKVADVIYLHNQSHVTIDNLDVSNATEGFTGKTDGMTAANAQKVGDFRAIHITGDNQSSTSEAVASSDVTVQNSTVHDVSGLDLWINSLNSTDSLSKPNGKYPGAFGSGGWDSSKRTGGIFAETAGGTGPATFANVTVHNNTITNVSFGAFTIKQWDGIGSAKKWAQTSRDAKAPEYADSNFHPHTNVEVTDNTIDQTGQYNGDGIYVTSTRGAHVQGNWVKQPGVCGIELYFVDNAVVENNEVFQSMRKAGGGDSNALDPDRHTTNAIFQYNYVHDNGDGVLICGFAYNSTIFRYNVFKDNSEIWIRDSVGEKGGFIGFYNNILLNTKDSQYNGSSTNITFANSNGGGGSADTWEYRNNIFVNTSDKITSTSFGSTSTKNSFDTNVFWGPGVSTTGTNALNIDPKFKDLEAAKNLGSGTDAHHRVTDFSSLELAEDSPLRYISGWNYSADDHSGQIVSKTNGLDYSGTAAVDGKTTIGLFNVKQSDLQGNGTVSGTVKNASGTGVEGASVTVLDKDGKQVATATTDANGNYSVADVPAGANYTVEASHKDYYGTQKASNLTVVPGTTVTANVTLRSKGKQDTMMSQNFESYDKGDFTGDDNWGVSGADGNTIEITADPTNAGNKVLHMKRNTGKPTVWYGKKGESNWSGQFTISAKVMRGEGSNQYSLYTYHKSGWNSSSPADSKNPEATIAMRPNEILTHNVRGSGSTVKAADYETGKWAQVDIVIDWNTGTYDYWVDGKMTLENQPLRTWAGDMDYLSLFSTDGSGDFYVDDIDVYRGTPDYSSEEPDDALQTLVDTDFSGTTHDALKFNANDELSNGALKVGKNLAQQKGVKATLPVEVRAQGQKVRAQFDWKVESLNAPSGQGAKSGLEFRDDYGRLLFAMVGVKTSGSTQLRVATSAADADYTVSGITSSQFAAGEPKWSDKVSADPTKDYRVTVEADFANKQVSWTIAPADGGDAVLSGTAEISTGATSMSNVYMANYWGTSVQSIDNLKISGSVAGNKLDLPLKGKTAYAFGDSIIAGHKFSSASFATFAAGKEGMNVKRWAVNGASIVKTNGYDWIQGQLGKADAAQPDMVILDGGTNDAEIIKNGKADVASYETALRSTFNAIITKWSGTKIVFVAVPKLYTRDAAIQQQLHDVQTKVCTEYGVTMADVYTSAGDGITEANKAEYSFDGLGSTGLPQAGTNTGSGTHPNFKGIETLYLPTVTAAMRAADAADAPSIPVDKSALQQAVDAAKKLQESDYTADSWKTLQTALAKAENTLNDADATQSDIDAAAKDLSTAVSALVKVNAVDKTTLATMIETARSYAQQTDLYTEESINALKAAITAAQSVYDDANATQKQVNQQVTALNNAVNALVVKPITVPVNKTALESAIAQAKQIDQSLYTDETAKALAEAIANAETVDGNATATQQEVNDATNAILNAVKALKAKPIPVNTEALKAAIAAAQAIDQSQYTDESVAALKTALDDAQQVLANANATQTEVENAAKALRSAIDGLKAKPTTKPADTKDLAEAIAAAQGINRADYTADSLATLDKALSSAQQVLANANATQTEVDNAMAALRDAYSKLVKQNGGSQNGSSAGNTDDAGNAGSGASGSNAQANGSQDGQSGKANADALSRTGADVAPMAIALAMLVAAGSAITGLRMRRSRER